MQQLYVLRRFSSWSFRLGVSVALLVSSAGLAASLLVGVAISTAEAPGLSWQATTSAPQAVSTLPVRAATDAPALPAALSSVVAPPTLLASAVASTSLPSPAGSQLAAQPTAFEAGVLPPTHSLRVTVQRAWHTFKLAFR